MKKAKLVLLPLLCFLTGGLSGCTKDDIAALYNKDSELQSQIDELKEEIKGLKDQIDTLRSQLLEAKQAIKDEYDAKIALINAKIEDLEDDIEDLTTQFNTDKQALQDDYNQKITNLSNSVGSQITSINQQIAQDEQALQALSNKHDADKQAIQEDYNTKITNLGNSTNSQIALLNQQITQDEQALQALSSKHDADKQALQDDYNEKLQNLSEEDEEARVQLQNDYNAKIAELDAAFEEESTNLQNQITANKNSIDAFKTQYATEKAALELDYNTKIDALDASFEEESTNLQNQITTNKNTVDAFLSQYAIDKAAIELDYNTKITNLTNTYLNKVQELENSISANTDAIAALEAEMSDALTAVENDYNAKINALSTRVSSLEGIVTHTVTFDTDGASPIEPAVVQHGEKVAKPTDPVKNGYTFNGWTYQGQPWVFFGYVITEDITLVADYTPIEYSITYVLDGGTNNPSNPASYTVEDSIVLADPTKSFNDFLGWFNENDEQVTSISLGSTGDITLEARWEVNEALYENEAIQAALLEDVAISSMSSSAISSDTINELEGLYNTSLSLTTKLTETLSDGRTKDITIEWQYNDSLAEYVKSLSVVSESQSKLKFNYGSAHTDSAGNVIDPTYKTEFDTTTFVLTAVYTCGGTSQTKSFTLRLDHNAPIYDDINLTQLYAKNSDGNNFEFVNGTNIKGNHNQTYYYVAVSGKLEYVSPDGNWGLLSDGNHVVEVYQLSRFTDYDVAAANVGNYVTIYGNVSHYKGNIQIAYACRIDILTDSSAISPLVEYGELPEGMNDTSSTDYVPFYEGIHNQIGQLTNVEVVKLVSYYDNSEIPFSSFNKGTRSFLIVKKGSHLFTIAYDYHTASNSSLFGDEIESIIKNLSAGDHVTVKGTIRYSSDDYSFSANGEYQLTPFQSGDFVVIS